MFALVLAVAAVGSVMAVGAAGPAAEPRPAVQAQDERLDNGTALARGGGGKFVSGREDDEEMQYVGNFTIGVKNHDPGASSGFVLYASGFQESIRLHWNILYQPDFSWSSCTASNAAAYGVDRGNDAGGTATDVSLLSAAKVLKFRDDGIYTGYYREEKLAGGPIRIDVEDQIIAGLNDCQRNPSEPGWYRVYARSNGSTVMDTRTDFAVAVTDYVYICEGCDSRQEAIEQLGPPPQTCPPAGIMPSGTTGITDEEWLCRTEDGTYYQRGENPSSGGGGGSDGSGGGGSDGSGGGGDGGGDGGSTPTATPPSGSGGGSGATATPTPGAGSGGGGDGGASTPTATATPAPTATPTPADRGGASTPAATPTPTATPEPGSGATATRGGGGGGSGGGGERGTAATARRGGGDGPRRDDTGLRTPTVGSGPGLGVLAALVALAGAALLAVRRD